MMRDLESCCSVVVKEVGFGIDFFEPSPRGLSYHVPLALAKNVRTEESTSQPKQCYPA